MADVSFPSSTLVLGGARSGKSAFAEKLALRYSLTPFYFATAQAFDAEMKDRISMHQISRKEDGWHTLEEPLDLAKFLMEHANPERIILVDCLTLWLSNLMMAERSIEDESDTLANNVKNLNGPIIFVSNEVGQGIVPDNKLARDFRDHAGRLHQKIAKEVEAVYFVTAGLPRKLK